MPSFEDIFIYIFVVIIVIVGIAEAGILAYAYFNADKVSCNWLWCTFTDVRSESRHDIIMNSRCSVNGVPVNCSEYIDRFPDYEHTITGINEYQMNGVCPGWEGSIEDCF